MYQHSIEANADTTYINTAHFNASLAPSPTCGVVIFVVFNYVNALFVASNSTGNVPTENNVVFANKIMAINNMVGALPLKDKRFTFRLVGTTTDKKILF